MDEGSFLPACQGAFLPHCTSVKGMFPHISGLWGASRVFHTQVFCDLKIQFWNLLGIEELRCPLRYCAATTSKAAGIGSLEELKLNAHMPKLIYVMRLK